MNASIYNALPYIMLINANYIDYKITINKNPRQTSGVLTFKWYLQESNQGHKDFQSFALPTELRYQP